MSQKPSAELTLHVGELLEDNLITRSIAVSHPQIERVLIQTAIDLVTQGNVADIGPALLGIKLIQDTMLLFKTKGNIILESEKQKNASTSDTK